MSDRLDQPTFPTLCKDITLFMRLFSKSLAIGFPASLVGADKDGSSPSVPDRLHPPTFPTLCKYTTLLNAFVFSSLSPSDFWLVGSVFIETDRVHPCPVDLIRRLFLSPAKSLLYGSVCFSKSLALGLPASRVDVTLGDPTQFGCIGQPSAQVDFIHFMILAAH